jgi:MtrB/PioB family decaheme-associated outer membrane protein
MRTNSIAPSVSRLIAASALALPAAQALAADEVQALTSPNQAEVGLRLWDYGTSVPPYQREFSGISGGTHGSVDANLVSRGEDGLWYKVSVRDLHLPTQEAGALIEKQGKWMISYDRDEIVKYAPYTINSKVGGIGTGTVSLNQDFRSSAGRGPLSNLELTRVRNGVAAYLALRPGLRLNLGARVEDKSGAIMSASIGSTRNNALGNGKNYSTMFFAPQPQDYRHRQFDASLDYAGKKLQLTGGFYGSYFNNNNLALHITPGYNSIPTVNNTTIPAGNYAIPWISLPPDNSAQQWYLSGGYSFSKQTRLTFKVATALTRQDDGFIPAYGTLTTGYGDLNPPGVPYATGITATSLNGLIETRSIASTFTSRFTPKLDFKASLRIQDRDDQTPRRNYLDAAASSEFPSGRPYEPDNERDTVLKADMVYRLPAGFRVTGGYDYQKLHRPGTPRAETTENTLRVELQRAMSESLNGWIIYSYGRRTGGEWELFDPTPSTTTAVSFSTATAVAAPLQFSDRHRGKLRIMADWSPTPKLSGQVYYEHSRDSYPFVPATGYARMGMTSSSSELVGLDADLQITKKWHASAYYNYDLLRTHQNELYTPRPSSGDQNCAVSPTRAFTANCSPWQADLALRGMVLGAGLTGRVKKVDLVFNYLYSRDRTGYGITFDPLYPANAGGSGSSVPAGAGVLPGTEYSVSRLRLGGSFLLDKATRVRVDYIYDQRKVADYTWSNWSYSDGTIVNVAPNQVMRLVGVSLFHSF